MKHFLIVTMMALLLSSCSSRNTAVTDSWLGKWTGPEGTYLLLSKDTKKKRYVLSIQSLDYLQSYLARPVNDHLEFKRNGKVQMVRSGPGKATGMKWLQDKKECLIIKQGEAFCRK